jgi:GT2 family glycosyltransferase
LRCIRQENAGPAAARNNGFRVATGDIVLFVDDDIIVPSDIIQKHIEAHLSHANSVICGRCPFIEPKPLTPLFRYVKNLGHDLGANSEQEYIPINVVASGQISVERKMFDTEKGVYRDDLATPAAEEFELSLRLRKQGIPIFLATKIVALHDHPVELGGLCRQQYKHAMGCAEAAVKYPATLELSDLAKVIHTNANQSQTKSARQRVANLMKGVMAKQAARIALLKS